MGNLTHDLRNALRSLRNNPGSTFVLILALALGIAVNAAVFSLVDAVLFKPLPGRTPQRLVEVQTIAHKGSNPSNGVSYPIYKQYRDEMKGFADLAAHRVIQSDFSAENSQAHEIFGRAVTGNFFHVLGLNAEQGRLISDDDDGARGSNPVMVLSDRLWRRSLGARNVIGSSIRLDGHAYTVIGIAPPDLKDFDRAAELWIPMSMATQASPILATELDRETNPMLFVLGRLADNVPLPQAQSKLEAVDSALGAGRIIHLFEGMEGEKTVAAPPPPSSKEPGDYIEWQRPWGILKPAEKHFAPDEIHLSWLLLGAASLVLLIACVDVAGLLLARSAQRQKETAIRLALGASRLQLLRQRFMEGILLAAGGATVGILLAFWISRLLLASAPSSISSLASAGTGSILNLRVCGFISAISLLVAMTLSLLTTWREASAALLESLKGEHRTVTTSLVRGIPAQAVLVAFQIAISFALLSGAGLLLRTLQNRARVNLGYNTDHLLSAWLDWSRYGYDKAQGAALLRPMQESLSQIPGVESAALRVGGLFGRGEHGDSTTSNWDCSNLSTQIVGPGYFRTLEIPLLRGRDFSSTDNKNAPGVVIMNEAAAALCLPGKDPLHQYLSGVKTLKKPFEVIGVVGNMKFEADNEPPVPLLFVSLPQFYEAFPFPLPAGIVVRTAVEPHTLIPAIMTALRRLDGNFVLNNIETADDAFVSNFAEEGFLSNLLLAFGGLALILAAAGLYGVLSYLSARRTREFGIRLALGAKRGDVMSLVLLQGGRLILGSIVIGVFAAAASARLIRYFLFGVAGTDPLTYAATAAFVLLAGLIACSLPAWRATRVDPMVALREE